MEYTELFETRKAKTEALTQLISKGKAEERKLNETEEQQIETLKNEIQNIDNQIQEINNRNNNIQNTTTKNMENFKDLIVRSADGTIQNMIVETRALGLSSTIDNVTVDGSIASVGYKPFWQSMGVNYMPNLASSIELPFVGNIKAKKVSEGQGNTNDKAIATIKVQPARYTITEKIGKELMAVGNEAALQAFIAEMVVGCDKAITSDIYTVIANACDVVTGVTYTTTGMDKLVGAVDGNVTLLMPRANFYTAKGVKADEGSGKFLAEKTSSFAGNLWDGTPLFYSNLFEGTSDIAADLSFVTVAEFGNSVEISYLPIPSLGQVEITVCKLANVVLRNANAAVKTPANLAY